jgi:hypothetical protein
MKILQETDGDAVIPKGLQETAMVINRPSFTCDLLKVISSVTYKKKGWNDLQETM